MRSVLLFLVLGAGSQLSCSGQSATTAQPTTALDDSISEEHTGSAAPGASFETADVNSPSGTAAGAVAANPRIAKADFRSKFSYYMTETYLNPSVVTAPGFTAMVFMAAPPGKGTTRYPSEWRQGAEAFGRNYGDGFATRISIHTALFLTGVVTHEDPHYVRSASRNFFLRSSHALAFTLVDRSDSGKAMPAFSNFAGAAAGGFTGMAYRPDGFRDVTHAGQRATVQFGLLGAGNLFREFAPQMPAPVRVLISLVAR
jgi:hypothetical protein